MAKSGKTKKKQIKPRTTRKAKRNTSRRYSPSEKKKILKASRTKSTQELYDIYGVSHESVRRWKLKENNLLKKKNKPEEESFKGSHPNWKKVLKIWKSRPGLGPLQIKNQMKRDNIKINVATVRLIMEENGYTPPKAIVKDGGDARYEAIRPLEIVHMDFKHFYINKQKVYLLLFQDDYSRFITGYKMTDSENMDAVISVFESSINRYGKMQTVMTDAGSAFYCWNGINKFQRLISEEYGVDQIKAGSPRSNGKLESVNKQIEKELLRVSRFSSLEEADQAISEWVQFYNFSRTHMGLPDATVPADRFLPDWNKNNHDSFHSTITEQLSEVPHYSGDSSIWIDILKLVINKLK